MVAKRLQRVARQLGAVLIVASSQPEIFAAALCPDQVVHLTTAWEHRIMSGSEFIDSLLNHCSTFAAPTLPILAKYLPDIRCGKKCTTIRKGQKSINKGILLLKAKKARVTVNVTALSRHDHLLILLPDFQPRRVSICHRFNSSLVRFASSKNL